MINPFKRSYSPKELNLFRFLSRIPLFDKLSYPEMELFVPYMYLRHYNQDEVVFFRDDPSHALYIVKSGKVSLNVDLKDDFEVLRIVKSGEAFGDNSLLEHSRRIYSSVVTSETADFYVIPQVNIHEIFSANLSIKSKMIESLAESYDKISKKLFKSYQSSFGFFALAQAFGNERDV